MMTVVRQLARVLPGHRVEIVAPELTVGDIVDVIVSPRAVQNKGGVSVIEFLDSLPADPRAVAPSEKYEETPRDQHALSPSLYDRLQDLIGQAQDLPPDASQQIDHYLYGTPKRP